MPFIRMFETEYRLGDLVVTTARHHNQEPTKVIRIEYLISDVWPSGHVRYVTQQRFDSYTLTYSESELRLYIEPIVLTVGDTYIFDLTREYKNSFPMGWRWQKQTKRRLVAKYDDGRLIFTALGGPSKDMEHVVKEEHIDRSTLEEWP